MKKQLCFYSAGVSLTLALISMPSHALDAWELYQQAKPDQVGVIAASKMAREQCTKENEATPCNNIGNVLRVFRKQIKTFFYEGGGTPEQNQLYDEGKLWCPLFRDTGQAIYLYADFGNENKSNFKNNLDEIKNKYRISTLRRLDSDAIISEYTRRKHFFIQWKMTDSQNTPCEDYIKNYDYSITQAILENKIEARNNQDADYIGQKSDIEDDIRLYSHYTDEKRLIDEIIAAVRKRNNNSTGETYQFGDLYQPRHMDIPFEYSIDSMSDDVYEGLIFTLRFQHRKDIPVDIINTWIKDAHTSYPLNPIITAQYLDSLMATKNKNEIATVERFLEGIAYPLIQTERKSNIIKLQDRTYFGRHRVSNKCLKIQKCSAYEVTEIKQRIKIMLEASDLLKQKSELYEAAARQVKKLELPKYYEKFFLRNAAKYSQYSVELKWNTDQWRDLAKQAAKLGSSGNYGQTDMDSSTNQSYIGNNAEQSGEGASSNFNRMIESSRPYLKGKDLQRLNQYQNGMDLLNSIMGQ